MSKNRGSAIIDYENGIILIKRIKGYGQNKKYTTLFLEEDRKKEKLLKKQQEERLKRS